MRRISSSLLVVMASGTVLLGPGGCYNPQGSLMPSSNDPATYYSYETAQKTVTIIDLRTGEEIFTMDIPPGKQLTMDFEPGEGDDPVNTPDLMRYAVWDQGTTTGKLKDSMTVPNAASRRIDVSVRQSAAFQPQPASSNVRTDQAADRPDWWTPEGGPMPDDRKDALYDD